MKERRGRMGGSCIGRENVRYWKVVYVHTCTEVLVDDIQY